MDYSLIFENFSNWIDLNFYYSLILFFLFILLYSSFSLPGLLLCFVFAGFSFGIVWSYLICAISFTLGCFCFYISSKFFLSKFFKKKYKKYSNKIDYFIQDSSFEYIVIFRLIPGTPLIIQNLVLSLLEISNYKFILSTFIGLSPYLIFCILIGNKINNIANLNTISSKDIFTFDFILILFVLILLICLRIFFKKRIIK